MMQNESMKNELLFSKSHIWVHIDGETIARLGISDYAQERLGTIMFLNLPEVGDIISVNECMGDIESLKTVSDLISPIDGEVLKVNSSLEEEPNEINQAPYNCWMLEVKAEKFSEELMDAQAYADYVRKL